MGKNRDYFSGINGNWNIVWDFPRSGTGMGTKSWEWEEMGTRKSLPHISKQKLISPTSACVISANTNKFGSHTTLKNCRRIKLATTPTKVQNCKHAYILTARRSRWHRPPWTWVTSSSSMSGSCDVGHRCRRQEVLSCASSTNDVTLSRKLSPYGQTVSCRSIVSFSRIRNKLSLSACTVMTHTCIWGTGEIQDLCRWYMADWYTSSCICYSKFA